MALPPHLVRFSEHLPATSSVVVNGDTVRFGDGTLACPATVPARGVASVLHDLGIGAAAIVEMSAGLAAPCRLIRFDTHGTVFVIEEPVPELIAYLKLLRLESAVHKQGYAVERL